MSVLTYESLKNKKHDTTSLRTGPDMLINALDFLLFSYIACSAPKLIITGPPTFNVVLTAICIMTSLERQKLWRKIGDTYFMLRI